MKKNRLIILAVLVTIFAMLLTGCAGNTESKETTLPKIEMSTTETLPETETSVTKTETPETTEEITKAETTKKQEYVPVETTKKATKTKAPETTKKQETKPATTEKVETENEYVAELPTTPSGAIDFGAMVEEDEFPGEGTYF